MLDIFKQTQGNFFLVNSFDNYFPGSDKHEKNKYKDTASHLYIMDTRHFI